MDQNPWPLRVEALAGALLVSLEEPWVPRENSTSRVLVSAVPEVEAEEQFQLVAVVLGDYCCYCLQRNDHRLLPGPFPKS